jgi:hypothetical protein
MQFIEFDDLGSRTLDLLHMFPKRFHPLIDRHMTKPQDPTNGPKPQAFQVQGQRQSALVRRRRIGFMGNGKKVLTPFAFVPLAAFVDPTFDFVRTGTPRTIQHLRLLGKGWETSLMYIC